MYDNAVGGNDKLISGTGPDEMWGDGQFGGPHVKGGADVFVFKPASGNDLVFDFRDTDHDKIDVSGYGYHGIGQLNITGSGSDTQIDFGGGNSVTLVGWADPTQLSASDFIFK
jgi:Ca2+-binding RTX toxin-like protein